MEDEGELIKTICVGGDTAREKAMLSLDRVLRPHLRRRFMGFHQRSFEQADDLVQDVMMRILKAACSFRGGGARGWVHRIADHLFIDSVRREGREPPTVHFHVNEDGVVEVPEPADREPDDAPRLVDVTARALEMLDERDPQRARALRLSVTEGLHQSDIAQLLGRSVAATTQYLFESRKKLRQIIAELIRTGEFE